MGKPKGELGLAIMLGGGKSKKSFDSDDEDVEETSEESEESSDSGLGKKAALMEEMESCKAEEDWEGAAKAFSTLVKLCKY